MPNLAMSGEHVLKELAAPEEALSRLLAKCRIGPRAAEYVGVRSAVGRVLAEDVVSRRDVPPFDRAAMDGYAVRSADVSSASQSSPAVLRVVGEASADRPFTGRLGRGEAVRIDTGARMPEGADAVVMLEYTRREGDTLYVYSPASPLQNVAVRGEDMKRGSLVARRGTLLTPYDVAALAAAGWSEVRVYAMPRIAIASIGSELREPWEASPEDVVETNRMVVAGVLSGYPVVVADKGILPDDIAVLEDFYSRASEEADMIITMGGTSLGKGDYAVRALERAGEVVVHGVSLYPSRPVALGVVGGKPVLALPGYPVAVAIGMSVFGEELVRLLCGIEGRPVKPRLRGKLLRRLPSKLGLRHYARGRVVIREGEVAIEPVVTSGAGLISSLSSSDGFVVVSEGVEGYEAGEEVEIELYRRYIRGGER